MKARLVKFGEIEVEGKRYTHDVVIEGGKVRKRKKGPSKQFREKFGHTPLRRYRELFMTIRPDVCVPRPCGTCGPCFAPRESWKIGEPKTPSFVGFVLTLNSGSVLTTAFPLV